MDPQYIDLLNKIQNQVNENNLMMKQVLQQNKIAFWSKIGYWVFIILLTVGAFALLKPVMNSLKSIYLPSNTTMNTADLNMGSVSSVTKLIGEFKDLNQ